MNEMYLEFIEIKCQTDALLLQLSEGKYKDPNTFINNYIHLQKVYCRFRPYLADINFVEWAVVKDKTTLVEIVMTGRAIMCMHNFHNTLSRTIQEKR